VTGLFGNLIIFMIEQAEREKAVRWSLNRPELLMHDASASEPMITVRPARLVTPHPNPLPQGARGLLDSPPLRGGDQGEGDGSRALKAAGRTLLQDRPAKGLCAVKRPGKCVQLLVVYYQRKQSEQRVERELQQWQRQQQQ